MLEPGCIILPQAYVGADVHLGVGCIVNAGASWTTTQPSAAACTSRAGGIVKAGGASVAEFAKVDSGEMTRFPWETT